MHRQIRLSIALTLSISFLLVSLPATAQGQQRQKFKADTGVITPGVGQVLRITVLAGAGNDAITFKFAWMKYMIAGCNPDSVCRHIVASQGTTAPVTINGDDVASFDVQGTGNGVRVVVLTNSRDVRIIAQLINPNGEATSFLIIVEALP